MIQLIAKTYTTLISPCWLCAGNTGHLRRALLLKQLRRWNDREAGWNLTQHLAVGMLLLPIRLRDLKLVADATRVCPRAK